jgi:hypothetical protein
MINDWARAAVHDAIPGGQPTIMVQRRGPGPLGRRCRTAGDVPAGMVA